jgi:1-phosphofructokinase family hexose kinase
VIATVTLNPTIDKTIHVSRLALNDTNRVIKMETDAGGKGINCSRMVKELGGDTLAVAFLGGSTGEMVKSVLRMAEIDLAHIETSCATRTCIAIEESTGNPPTSLNELGGPIEHDEFVRMLEVVRNAARSARFVVFGGSVPLGLTPEVYRVLMQVCHAKGIKTVLDTDGSALHSGIATKPWMVKPNRAEAERLTGKTLKEKPEVARAALEIANTGIDVVVISLGSQGAVAASGGCLYDVVAPKTKPISTIGSGDSFIGGFLVGMERGLPVEECLRLGAAAGAATAISDGSCIGSKVDVDRLLGDVKVTILASAG